MMGKYFKNGLLQYLDKVWYQWLAYRFRAIPHDRNNLKHFLFPKILGLRKFKLQYWAIFDR